MSKRYVELSQYFTDDSVWECPNEHRYDKHRILTLQDIIKKEMPDLRNRMGKLLDDVIADVHTNCPYKDSRDLADAIIDLIEKGGGE
jgi:hypothetical protein